MHKYKIHETRSPRVGDGLRFAGHFEDFLFTSRSKTCLLYSSPSPICSLAEPRPSFILSFTSYRTVLLTATPIPFTISLFFSTLVIMCNLETEGTKYACGHYVITKKLRKVDCYSPYCIHSARHKNPCPDCSHHEKFLGPDLKETVTCVSKEFCDQCQYWYQKGRR
ncbi:hypothetical protein ABKN59_010677 [Abortiporus biennis]